MHSRKDSKYSDFARIVVKRNGFQKTKIFSKLSEGILLKKEQMDKKKVPRRRPPYFPYKFQKNEHFWTFIFQGTMLQRVILISNLPDNTFS